MDLGVWSGLGRCRSLRWKGVALAVSALALSLAQAGDASACGGCFVSQTESTQVNSHKMILSISPDATTLWDQIEYSGSPESFAWILPVKGVADIGLSSDALFQALDQMTSVQIASPQLNCNPNNCPFPAAGNDAAGSGTGGGGGGVTVVAQKTVGPYDTVQLKSQDPNALTAWLTSHQYNIPADVKPIIDAYVAEQFDFIALRLSPGQGVNAMRPVRVTLPGANAGLPLRMVAAGTGTTTPITLWVLGEGRYQPSNFSTFTIQASELVWDWDTKSSNYKQLRAQRFKAAGGKAWQVEAAEPMSMYGVRDQITYLAQNEPQQSGYADAQGMGAVDAANADLSALFSTIPQQSVWVTRLYGELSRPALAADLRIGASTDQTQLPRYLQATRAVGKAPACPAPPPQCGGPDGDGGNVYGANFFWNETPSSSTKASSCATDGRTDAPITLGGAAALAALVLVRRRARR